MADNIYFLPNACGPMLREYYGKLLQEPIPQQLKDLLAMLEEAAAGDAGAGGHAQASAGEPDLNKPK